MTRQQAEQYKNYLNDEIDASLDRSLAMASAARETGSETMTAIEEQRSLFS